ncbi:hypothetical protein BB560_004427 [Smittium megazygosporum]|uniref:Rho-GAP domain-containing protein n=1 Tax=Smittium megazygosporum TaxID=133381 RepID=A0A2T9Z992_9FUNG|nr:hypothetical protein BB560_004427 [Smittium megazygosporum]
METKGKHSSTQSTLKGTKIIRNNPGAPDNNVRWATAIDTENNSVYYVDVNSGDCCNSKPDSGILLNNDPETVWWKVYDEETSLNFYYNPTSQETEWVPPEMAIIISASVDKSKDNSTNATKSRSANNVAKGQKSVGAKKEASHGHNSSWDSNLTKFEYINDQKNRSNEENDYFGFEPGRSIYDSPTKLSFDVDKELHNLSISNNKSTPPAPARLQGSKSGSPLSTEDNRLGPKDDATVLQIYREQKYPYKPSNLHQEEPNSQKEGIIQSDSLRSEEEEKDERSARQKLKSYYEFLNTESLEKLSNSVNSETTRNDGDICVRINEDPESYLKFEKFAKKNFVIPKRGIFRKRLTQKDLVSYTSEGIEYPLLDINKRLWKVALDSFYIIRSIMDAKVTVDYMYGIRLIQQLVNLCGSNPDIVDEVYCQICKQLVRNYNVLGLKRGWGLMSVMALSCCPKDAYPYIIDFILDQSIRMKKYCQNDQIYVDIFMEMSRTYYCLIRFSQIGNNRIRPLKREEIRLGTKISTRPPLFGAPLENVMLFPEFIDKNKQIPQILSTLVSSIKRLNGHQSEGLFRIPGNSDKVFLARLQFEAGQSALINENDVNVYASLLKEWLRELKFPLIDSGKYDQCISAPADVNNAHRIIGQLPPLYQRTSVYLLGFLNFLSLPENAEKSKMTVSNLAVVFSPCFLRCENEDLKSAFANTSSEQSFLETLIVNPVPEECLML